MSTSIRELQPPNFSHPTSRGGPSLARSAVQHTIAFTELPLNVSASLKSMLTLLGRTMATHWVLTEPANCDVLVTSVINSEVLGAGKQADGSVRIAVLDHGVAWQGQAFTIAQPAQLSHFRDSLEQATLALQDQQAIKMTRTPAPVREHWLLPESLLAATREQSTEYCHLTHWKDGTAFIFNACAMFFWCTEDALSRLREGNLPVGPALRIEKSVTDDLPEPRRADYLLWSVGFNADSSQLAPWLNPAASFRLRRWPDFGAINYDPRAVRLTAMLTERPWTPTDLARAGHVDLAIVHRVLNACSLLGLLDTLQAQHGEASIVRRNGFFTTLVGAIRHRIGLDGA